MCRLFFSGLRFNISLKKNCYAPPAQELQTATARNSRQHTKFNPPNNLMVDKNISEKIYTFVNTKSKNYKSKKGGNDNKKIIGFIFKNIKGVNLIFCNRKLVIFKHYMNLKKNAHATAWAFLICSVGIPIPRLRLG